MKFLLIRHGETDWNKTGRIQGSQDICLNEIGIEQAREVAEKLLALRLERPRLFTSKQQRAKQTAEVLEQCLGTSLNIVEGLQEVNFGKWEGKSWAQVQADYPADYQQWFLHRRHTRPLDGESYQDMLDRLSSALIEIAGHDSSTAIIVTHSAVIMSLKCILTDTDFSEMTKFKTGNTEIVEVDSGSLMSRLRENSSTFVNLG